MTREVLFIQGGGGGAHREDAKLADSLRRQLGPNYRVRYPAMANEEDPDYAAWKGDILREIRDMGDDAILVGHSIGASVLARLLADGAAGTSIAGVFLVAGPFWHDHQIWRWDEVALPADAAGAYPRGLPLFLYHGDADEVVPVSHLDMYARALPRAVVRRLGGRNHQLNEDMTEVARDIRSLD